MTVAVILKIYYCITPSLPQDLLTPDTNPSSPQDLLTPDTAHFSKLVTPGGEHVFEFSSDHLLNNTCNNDQLLLGNRPATSQNCEVTPWAVT